MSVAAYVQALVVKSVVAGKCYMGVDGPFLQSGECLCNFECRTWRIGTHYGTVEQGAFGVFFEQHVVFATVAAYHCSWVVGGG